MSDANYLKESLGGQVSKLQQLHIDTLQDQENLCLQCNDAGKDVMLCSGLRLALNRETWEKLGKIRTFYFPCGKYEAKEKANGEDERMAKSGLPPNFIANCKFHQGLTFWVDESSITFHNYKAPPICRMTYSAETTKQLMGYLFHGVKYGNKVRYIIPYLLMTKSHAQVKDTLKDIMDEAVDLVVIDRLDFLGDNRFDRNQLFQAIAVRIQSGFPTVITLSNKFDLKNRDDYEVALLKQVGELEEVKFG